MDCLEAIRTRRTIRKYSKQPVEFEKVIAVIEAGTLAPSSGNIQNWMMTVITDKHLLRDSLFHACLDQDVVGNAQVAIVVCSDDHKIERQYGLRGERLYSVQNCAAAIQNMLLAAHVLGLGASWVGAFNEDRVRALLLMPDNARPHAIITLGYPDEVPAPKRTWHIDDVIYWNRYGARYKDIHRVVGDLSVEWEKQIEEKKERLREPTQKIMKNCREFLGKCHKMVKGVTKNPFKKDKKEDEKASDEDKGKRMA